MRVYDDVYVVVESVQFQKKCTFIRNMSRITLSEFNTSEDNDMLPELIRCCGCQVVEIGVEMTQH